ncbi:MAG TPA: hypothetical protein VFW40_05970 [Capsulimonadaceae bacterium]|nr:hypothetical protein [Capsulimonadaceae bacterium]
MPADNAPPSAPSGPPAAPPNKKRGGSNKRQRHWQFVVRCTEPEFEAISAKANAHGLKGGAYLRAQGLEGDAGPRAQHVPPIENQILSALRGDLGRLNNNVNQIAHHLNMGDYYSLPELRQVLMDYPALRDGIFSALGREPSPETLAFDEFIALVKDAMASDPKAQKIAIPVPLLLRIITGLAASKAAPPPKGAKK